MYALRFNHRRDYPNVMVSYAGDDTELEIIKAKYIKLGFSVLETEKDMAKEYSKVLMVMDENFYYDEKCYLRSRDGLAVRKLFRGLGRAGKAITIIVKNNEDVFDVLLTILQGQVK